MVISYLDIIYGFLRLLHVLQTPWPEQRKAGAQHLVKRQSGEENTGASVVTYIVNVYIESISNV